MDIYKEAVKQKLTFPTSIGVLSLYDLRDLPLTSQSEKRPSLNSLAVQAHTEIQKASVTSFVDTQPTGDPVNELRLAILKDVIADRQAEAKEAEKRRAKQQELKRLQELKGRKLQEADESLSVEELDKRIKELGA